MSTLHGPLVRLMLTVAHIEYISVQIVPPEPSHIKPLESSSNFKSSSACVFSRVGLGTP